jgi:hypothetical protein
MVDRKSIGSKVVVDHEYRECEGVDVVTPSDLDEPTPESDAFLAPVKRRLNTFDIGDPTQSLIRSKPVAIQKGCRRRFRKSLNWRCRLSRLRLVWRLQVLDHQTFNTGREQEFLLQAGLMIKPIVGWVRAISSMLTRWVRVQFRSIQIFLSRGS